MKNYKTPKGLMWALCYLIILAAFPGSVMWADSFAEIALAYTPIIILFIYLLEKALNSIYDND